MHNHLLVVIVSFGLIFVVSAALALGLSLTLKSDGPPPWRGHGQLTAMLLISNFIIVPALFIGLGAIIHFAPQVKMAIVALALCAGAPFIPWLVSLAKGNVAYSGFATVLLTVGTIILMPLLLPPFLRALHTGASPSIWLVLWPMLLFILLPFLVGVVIRARYPDLAMQIAPWLGPVSATFLLVHVTLFIGYSWSSFLSIAGAGQMLFTLAFPIAGMLIGYVLSPPYILSPMRPADSHRGTKVVSAVSVAQQNTGAVICCAIFALGKYLVAGDYMLLGAVITIIVVAVAMAELGARFAKHQKEAPAPGQAPAVPTATPDPPKADPVGTPTPAHA